MSYDAYVMFSENGMPVEDSISLTESITGVKLPAIEESAQLLGLRIEVHYRSPLLKEASGFALGEYRYQIDMSSPSWGGELIHPVGFYLAREFSRRLGDHAALLLAGGEYLGALFYKGRIIHDEMASRIKVHSSGPWSYGEES